MASTEQILQVLEDVGGTEPGERGVHRLVGAMQMFALVDLPKDCGRIREEILRACMRVGLSENELHTATALHRINRELHPNWRRPIG